MKVFITLIVVVLALAGCDQYSESAEPGLFEGTGVYFASTHPNVYPYIISGLYSLYCKSMNEDNSVAYSCIGTSTTSFSVYTLSAKDSWVKREHMEP